MIIELTNPERLELLKYINKEIQLSFRKVTIARLEKLYRLQEKLTKQTTA